jgi:CPA2 family monovalent cation:H+ antiporter-2
MSVSQIGEFSFIIATLGLTLDVTSEFLYPVAVAVSAITTFTTPYMIRLSEPLSRWVEGVLPEKWKAALDAYSSGTQTVSTTSDWRIYLRSYALNLVVFSVIVLAIIIVSAQYLNPLIKENMIGGSTGEVLTTAITFVFMAPFLWALAVRHPGREELGRLWANRNYRSIIIVMKFARIGVAVLFIAVLLIQFFSVQVTVIIGLGIIAILIGLSRRIQDFYIQIENSFLSNLNAREISDAARMHRSLTPWDAHLTSFEVLPDVRVVGHTLQELQIREKFGINVAVIERGERAIMPPTSTERIFPGDKLYVFGSDEQMAAFRQFLHAKFIPAADGEAEKEGIKLQKLLITADSELLHKSIRDSGVREKAKGLIVGVEKKGKRILNPDSSLVFEENDIVWIVGNPWRIKALEAARQEVSM